MKICIIVPIKTINKRLPGKTTRLLGGKPLYTYLFETLKKQTAVKDVFIDSSDEGILGIAKEWGFNILKRPEKYDSDNTTGDDLIERVIKKLDYDIVGLLHITSPFLKPETIEKAISIISGNKNIDSLIGVVSRYNRFWFNGKPVNHDIKKLVGTQFLNPINEEADFYFFRKTSFLKYRKRVCGGICFCEVDTIEAVDIDTIEDFVFAESLINSKII